MAPNFPRNLMQTAIKGLVETTLAAEELEKTKKGVKEAIQLERDLHAEEQVCGVNMWDFYHPLEDNLMYTEEEIRKYTARDPPRYIPEIKKRKAAEKRMWQMLDDNTIDPWVKDNIRKDLNDYYRKFSEMNLFQLFYYNIPTFRKAVYLAVDAVLETYWWLWKKFN